MEKFRWSLPYATRDPYIPDFQVGTWSEYMDCHYPAYTAMGLYTWDEILKYLEDARA